ncbi:MAG: hypothetical protein HQL17_01575 [Candidatus Omnitrophica bacterium]|nr:hypothetical protein [Candidatus Omnitrophota bacterium]
MDNSAVNFSVSSGQVIVALIFQMWLVIFPVILMIKINRLTRLWEERFGGEEEDQHV